MEKKDTLPPRPHALTLESRKHLTLTGISSVDSFNDTHICLKTSSGLLYITGRALSVSNLNVADGTLTITGEFDLLRYKRASEGLGRLFK